MSVVHVTLSRQTFVQFELRERETKLHPGGLNLRQKSRLWWSSVSSSVWVTVRLLVLFSVEPVGVEQGRSHPGFKRTFLGKIDINM